jgi:hypothetical protein
MLGRQPQLLDDGLQRQRERPERQGERQRIGGGHAFVVGWQGRYQMWGAAGDAGNVVARHRIGQPKRPEHKATDRQGRAGGAFGEAGQRKQQDDDAVENVRLLSRSHVPAHRRLLSAHRIAEDGKGVHGFAAIILTHGDREARKTA